MVVASGGLLTPHDVEGKFELLLQDRYRFSVSFLGPQTALPPRATHITKACPPCTLLPGDHTPAHDHATWATARHSSSLTSAWMLIWQAPH